MGINKYFLSAFHLKLTFVKLFVIQWKDQVKILTVKQYNIGVPVRRC